MIPLARPWLGEEELEAVRRPLSSGWITQGPEVTALEAEFRAYLGAPHACAVSNGTTALDLALRAVGVAAGDEVITVSHSFIATANAVRYQGAVPVFVDVDPKTFNLDPGLLEGALSERTRCVLAVHQIGMPCDLRAVLDFARRHELPLVEDAACAIGSEIHLDGAWRKIGAPHGDVATFSFHPRKVLTTGEGGLITTRSAELDARVRRWRHHSMSLAADERAQAGAVRFPEFPDVGHNYRLSDILAAIGRVQLRRVPAMVERRRALAARYGELLADLPGIEPPHEPRWARSNWQSYCVRLPEGIEQLDVLAAFKNAEIGSSRGVHCAHLEPAYANSRASWRAAGSLVHSEQAMRRCVMLPLFHELRDSEQVEVVRVLARAMGSPRASESPDRARER